MSVGFGGAIGSPRPGGSSSFSLAGVTSGDPILLFSASATNTPSDSFSTPYTWTDAGSGGFLYLQVGQGGAGTSGTINGTSIICAVSLTGASKAAGAGLVDSYAGGTSESSTQPVTPSVSGEAVLALITGPDFGVQWSGPTPLVSGNLIEGYPSYILVGDTGIAPGTPVTFSYGTFGGFSHNISVVVFPSAPPTTAQLCMPL